MTIKNPGATDSELSTELDNYVKRDGTTDLTGDWTISNNNITLESGNNITLESGKIELRDAAIYLTSDDDGHLDITADTSIDINVGSFSSVETYTWLLAGALEVPELKFNSQAGNLGSIANTLYIRDEVNSGISSLFFSNENGTLSGTVQYTSASDELKLFNVNDIILDADTTIGSGAAGVDYTLTFDGQSNYGIITWMEDEDYFVFDDYIFNSAASYMYRDINIGAGTLGGPPGLQPGVVEILDNTGTGTGIYTYGLAPTEALSGALEIQHDYAEGTDLNFHIHWSGNSAPTGTDKVQWQLAYTVAKHDVTVAPVTTITVETDFDTQYENKFSEFAAIDGTAFEIGDQFLFTLTRIAASTDEYAGDALLQTVGIHYEVDSNGSRSIATK